MRRRTSFAGGVLFAALSGAVFTAGAQESHTGLAGATAATVGPVNAAITALNYGENGAKVDGLLVGANVLLTFSKPVCGGIASLGKVKDNVTYSGVALTFASGFQTVHVTSFTNGSITYPPPAPPKPAAYPSTTGNITQLNYSEVGTIDGFLFTPTSGPEVFVHIGTPGADLAKLLTVGQSLSVIGTLEPPDPCAVAGTISEVDASSLTINSTTFPLSKGMGFGFGRFR
ncbi:MAG TPA: hypothetical protein VKT49_10850 [Bryobacteraceae bacterium]|nr:hypothetical protein [Bryobacteraceae bacterium]